MFGSKQSKFPSYSSSYRKKKKPVDPILTTIILLIGVYLAWSSYTPTKPSPEGVVASDMRASLNANSLLPSDYVRSGIFSLDNWTPADAMQRTPKPMIKNLSPHWYKDGIPAKLEVYFSLNQPSDFFELLLAAKSGGNYGILVNSKNFETFFEAADGTRKVLRTADFPDVQESYSVIADTTDDQLFIAIGGHLLDTSEIEFANLTKLGASTNLTLASVSHFNVENSNGELEQLAQ